MKYLPREVAFAKLKAMVDGARIVREELRASIEDLRAPCARGWVRPRPGTDESGWDFRILPR
jgi:hypothetical protein